MKRNVLFVIVFVCISLAAFSQAPSSIPYQAVARDASGNLLKNTTICVQYRLYNAATGGTLLYEEHQQATTNALGLFSVNVGSGGSYDGGSSLTLGGINWGANTVYVEIGLDITGGCTGSNTYTTMGRNQMMSVPFALYAGSAASASGAAGGDLTGNYPNPSLAAVGTAGTYGTGSTYPVVTVDSKGRVTGVTTDALPTSLPPSGTAGGSLTGSYPNPGIGNSQVTYAKIQNESASTILGNPTGSAAAPSEILLGTGLGFSGTSIINTKPDQTVTITPSGSGISVSGSYPSFTISNTLPSSGGTVTSITASSPLTGGTITGSGSIGIPLATSSASGYLSSTDWYTFNNKVSGTSTQYYVPHWTTNSNSTGNLSTSGLIYDNGTAVGIGTGLPTQMLTVVDAGNTDKYSGTLGVFPLNLTQGISIGYCGISEVGSNGNNAMYLNAQGTGYLVLQNVGTGNVGIGTTAPSQTLEVNGNAQIDGTVFAKIREVTYNNFNFPGGSGYEWAASPGGEAANDFNPGSSSSTGTPSSASKPGTWLAPYDGRLVAMYVRAWNAGNESISLKPALAVNGSGTSYGSNTTVTGTASSFPLTTFTFPSGTNGFNFNAGDAISVGFDIASGTSGSTDFYVTCIWEYTVTSP